MSNEVEPAYFKRLRWQRKRSANAFRIYPQMAQIFADKTTESAAIGEICGGKQATVWPVQSSCRCNFPETLLSVAGIAFETLNHSTATNLKSS